MENIKSLSPLLSKQASISFDPSSAPRWSEYRAPKALAVVNVATEEDVAITVQHLTKSKISFLTQSGAHGWSHTLNLPLNGVIINLRGLNHISFNEDVTLATIGGGILVHEAISAASTHHTQVLTGNCDTVGVLGAALGGGFGNLTGARGMAIDQFVSMNVVLADGSRKCITEHDTDLWWAMRGAGPNFAIVTSAVVKAFPTPTQAESMGFTGALIFDEEKLESLVQAIEDLDLEPEMRIFLVYIAVEGVPRVMASVFYHGDSAADAKKAFAPIYALDPIAEYTAVTPYTEWNAGVAAVNVKGPRKPAYGASMIQLVPETWRRVWEDFKALLASDPRFVMSMVLCEAYPLKVAQALEPEGTGTAASYPGRKLRFNVNAIPWYEGEELDERAREFGSKAREEWRATSGLERPATYVNFAAGDEENEVVYGESTERLRRLKKIYDPDNVFGRWFSLAASST